MVATYTAADPENGDIAWSLSGDDADDFEISGAGTLTFVSSPDYENPMDENAGNMYSVMVVASDGTNDGAMGVTVTDVDENVAPEFAEDTTTREVEENTPQGGNIGGPVAAMAGDDDMLTPRQSCPPFPVRGFPAQLPDRHEPRQAPWWHRGRTGDLLNNQRPSELPITDWILNRLFGIDAFGYPTLDPTGETRLLCALCQNPTMLRKPFVLHHLQSSLAAWDRTGSVLAGWLCKHGPLTANAVLVGRLLAGYPSVVFQQALRDRELVPEVPAGPLPAFPLLALPYPSDLPSHLVDRLDTLMHDVLINLPIQEYLSCVSGALKIELDILVERLKNEVDIVPIGQIQDRFGSLVEAGYAGQLSELESLWAVKRQLVFPPIEARIDETWQRIVDFFKGHFLPAWRAARSSADTGIRERLIQVDEQYTDWLVQHFFDLSLLPSSPLADRVVQRRFSRKKSV